MAENDQSTTQSESQSGSRRSRRKAGVERPLVDAEGQDNASLEHTHGGATSRDDVLDQGVPMEQGDPAERVGPEDALGAGPKRGDYTGRQPEGSVHFQSVPAEDGGEPIYDENGTVVDSKPLFRLEHQNPHVEDRGEEPGLKGGVDTDPAAAAVR
jgi:hypothetical protein